ncbi:hypothetical protein [Pantoea cypripedii]|uniref:Uncharacterized protein n=1 Tax=Pantoea cypripedii TaxID=55209 RepID=A0A1X1EKI2_PANCY|nr:hypothetical protein [Pantoea cypripedii]ORM89435.1 hypothetical protein HA50_22630 [Pantoea cypripedii]
MSNNFNDPSNWHLLPAELVALLNCIQQGTLSYPERESHWQQAQDYLLNGNYSMAEHMFDTVRIRQENLRQGISPDLRLLMQAVQANAVNYPERGDNLQQAQDYLLNGNYSMAEHMFDTVRSRQDNLRQGIPPALVLLIQAVKADAVYYPEREDNLQQAQDYLQNGNYTMAEHMFDTVRSRQDNLRKIQ